MLQKTKKNTEVAEFSIDDVRKSIKVYADMVHSKTVADKDTERNVQDYGQNGEIIDGKNQEYINIFFALTRSKVQQYEDKPFIAQILVSTQEDKDIIDGIRKELTQFIIKRAHYEYLKLEVITDDKTADNNIPYSPVDKYRYLFDKYPAIEILKDNFKCEIKY